MRSHGFRCLKKLRILLLITLGYVKLITLVVGLLMLWLSMR